MNCDFSKLGTLKLNDFWKGFVLAIITAALTILEQSWSAGSLSIDLMTLATTCGTVGAAYLLKNLGTGAGGKILTNAPPSDPPLK